MNGNGLPSYPHPKMKYLINRGLAQDQNRKVWAFLEDGEMGEPESLGVISLPGHERLDNQIFVVNCNLQRLDGPEKAFLGIELKQEQIRF